MLSSDYKNHFKDTFYLAYPVCLSQLGHVMEGVADTFFVAQVGAIPLAAASFAHSIFFVVLLFGIGVSFGITPLIAKANGEKNYQEAGNIFRHGLVLCTIAGVILFAFLYSISFFLNYMHQPEEVVQQAIPFFNILVFSMIPLMIFQAFRQFCEGLAFTKQAMQITIFANLVNIILNYALVFGHFGFQPMGLVGSGWATFISRVMMAVAMGIFVFYSPHFKDYLKNFSFKGLHAEITRKILKIGIPAGSQFIFEAGAFSFATIMMGWIGAKTLAAHQIALNLATISYMVASGISAAAVVRVGNFLGQKDLKNLRKAGFTAFLIAIIFMASTGTTFIFSKDLLPLFYISDPEVIQIASTLLIIAALFQISDGVQVVGLGTLRGISDVKIPTLITFTAYWIVGLPMAYILGFKAELGAQGVWLGLLSGLTFSAFFLFFRFNQKTRGMKILEKHL